MHQAARVSDAGTVAAIEATHDGAHEADVAAECLAAMTKAGCAPAAFGPFIRPQNRIAEEHTTWGQGQCRHAERVMLELTGCVARYHASMGRLVYIGTVRDEDAIMAKLASSAFAALMDGLKPGGQARDVYDAWHRLVAETGLRREAVTPEGLCDTDLAPRHRLGGAAPSPEQKKSPAHQNRAQVISRSTSNDF